MSHNLGLLDFKIVSTAQEPDYLKVVGWASKDSIDTGNEIVPVETINEAVKEYAMFSNIREMHNPFLGGAGVADVLIVEDSGLWIEAKIYDEEVQKKILSGVYKGFSIGYITKDYDVRPDGVKVLKEIILIEISVVDRPMNIEALLQYGDEFKAMLLNRKSVNNEGDDVMSYVLTLEDKANMPDESFAFVGTIDGKFTRILPYRNADGSINPEATVASINILNSNRPEDVKFLTDDEKREIYKTLKEALDEVGYKGSIPELAIDREFSTKSAKPEVDAKDYDAVKEEVMKLRQELAELNTSHKGMFQQLSGKIKELLGIQKKAIEVDVSPTDYADQERLRDLKDKIYGVAWTLENVLYNILWDEELSPEDKELKAMKAFNDAKNDWVATFKEIVMIYENQNQSNSGSKTIQPKEGETVKEELIINGVRYKAVEAEEVEPQAEVQAPEVQNEKVDAQTPEAPESQEVVEEPQEEKQEEVPAEEAQPTEEPVEETQKFVSVDEFNELKSIVAEMKTLVSEALGQKQTSGAKFAEAVKENAKPVLAEDDPNFWV